MLISMGVSIYSANDMRPTIPHQTYFRRIEAIFSTRGRFATPSDGS